MVPFIFLALLGVAAASRPKGNTAIGNKRPSLKDFEVNRHHLEKNYPIFQSFDGEMYSGLLPAALSVDDWSADDSSFSSYFFWLFLPSGVYGDVDEDGVEAFRNDTLVVWLNGGPGCSSMIGNLVENGPVTLPSFRSGMPAPNPASDLGAPLMENEFAWTKKTAMLFVEQPGGVGFSKAATEWTGSDAESRTEDDVARDYYAFMQNFYKVFENLQEKSLFVAGESYAGMYIPSIARGIHHGNKRVLANNASSDLVYINLEGVAIGNGWIDANIQGPTVIDYAFWHGMIDLRTSMSLHKTWEECINNKQIVDDASEYASEYLEFHPFTTPDECGMVGAVMKAAGSDNMYDVTTYDTYPNHVDKDGTISKFFNDPDIRKALNAPSMDSLPLWEACVPGSGRRRRSLMSSHQKDISNERKLILLDKDRRSVVPYIAELLDDAKIQVLLYNGDLDLSCSSQSTEMALDSMKWSGHREWMDPDQTKWAEWVVDEQVAGHTKKYNNLEFVVVYNSGHFVPVNQGRNSLNLIGRLLERKSFGDIELPQFPNRRKGLTLPSLTAAPASHKHHGSIILALLGGVLLGSLVTCLVMFSLKTRISPSLEPAMNDYECLDTEITPLQGGYQNRHGMVIARPEQPIRQHQQS